MVDNVMILAGGSGTRLWPASKKAHPKQFMKVSEGKSLLQLTIERAYGLGISGKIYIVTIAGQLQGILDDCMNLDPDVRKRVAVIPEPCARNTAPALALAVSALKAQGKGDETALVLPADHMISPQEAFSSDVEAADRLARQGHLVTFGIAPTRAETGYGYIEEGAPVEGGRLVAAFREKPDGATAKEFLESGNFLWNSGMFAFSLSTFWTELDAGEPKVAELFSELNNVSCRTERDMEILAEGEDVAALYEASPSISVDYAVMEKTKKAAVVPSSFKWNDVGSWDEMSRLFEGADTDSEVITSGSENNFVYSDLPVALCGVENLMVVVKNGSVLVCKKDESQRVKDIVETLKSNDNVNLL